MKTYITSEQTNNLIALGADSERRSISVNGWDYKAYAYRTALKLMDNRSQNS